MITPSFYQVLELGAAKYRELLSIATLDRRVSKEIMKGKKIPLPVSEGLPPYQEHL